MTHTIRFRLRTLVVAAVAGIATIVAICIFQTFSSAPPPISLDPKIDCPRSVSLGECLYGSDKREIFTVRNSGGGELLLHTFSLSCTCSSIARVTSDGDRPIGNISLGAGEEVNIAVTVNVRSRFNGSMKTRISFQTSDQDTPEVGIDFAASRVIGGLTPIPGSCNFGSMPIGDKPLRTVHLVDEAVAPRKVTAVVSSNADRIQVTFIPSLLGAPMPMGVNNPGHYLGAIAITVDTSQPGPIDGHLVIHYDDGIAKTETVPIFCTVVATLTAYPELLTLRPSENDGLPVLAATVWLRSQGVLDQGSIRLLDSSGAVAKAIGSKSDFVPVRVSMNPAMLLGRGEQKWPVELCASVDGKTYKVPLKLFVESR